VIKGLTGVTGDARSANGRGDGDGRHSDVKRGTLNRQGHRRRPVAVVDPRNTSKQCSRYGHIDKNRIKRHNPRLSMSHAGAENADINAARNIASGAVVSLLYPFR
jgi:formylmethanofuran dehydrogenase subunit B